MLQETGEVIQATHAALLRIQVQNRACPFVTTAATGPRKSHLLQENIWYVTIGCSRMAPTSVADVLSVLEDRCQAIV